MSKVDEEFLNDVLEAIDNWEFSYDEYYEDGNFIIKIEFDEEDWDLCDDEIWDALNEVCHEWGAGIDYSYNIYYLCLEH